MQHWPDELLSIGADELRARWSWMRGSAGAVIIVQATSRLGPGGVAVINELRERSQSWLRLAILRRGERARELGPGDIEMLGKRVLQGMTWLSSQPYAARPKIGLFAEGQAVSIALWVATNHPALVAAQVLCGSRIDPASVNLDKIEASTLLITPGTDSGLQCNNRQAITRLRCDRRLEVIPNARRNLAQPGALETAALLSAGWFASHLRSERRP